MATTTKGAVTPDDERSIENEYPDVLDDDAHTMIARQVSNAVGFFGVVDNVRDVSGEQHGSMAEVRTTALTDAVERVLERNGFEVSGVYARHDYVVAVKVVEAENGSDE